VMGDVGSDDDAQDSSNDDAQDSSNHPIRAPKQIAPCPLVLAVHHAAAIDTLLVPALQARESAPQACSTRCQQLAFTSEMAVEHKECAPKEHHQKEVVVMMWPYHTHFRMPLSPLLPCGTSTGRCTFVPPSPGLVTRADYVLVHAPSMDQGGSPLLPPARPAHCRQPWIFFSQESSSNYPLQAHHAFRSLFAYNMTFELDHDVPVTYADRPYLSGFTYRGHGNVRKKRSKQIVAIIGKCASHTARDVYVQQLAQHLVLDSYGACLNNKPPPVGDAEWYNIYGESKLQVMSEYHFCVAFENSRHLDYVTEKVFQAYAAGCVPLYDGAPNVASLLPYMSYIDRKHFKDAHAMAVYLRQLVDSPHLYAQYFRWKSNQTEVAKLEYLATLGSDSSWCRLCDLLLNTYHDRE